MVLPFLAGYYLSYVYRAIHAVIGPRLAADFGLGAAELGFLTGIYFLTFGLFQVPLGVLLDRYGPRRVNGTLLVLAALGAFAFASAASVQGLVLSRALIGLGVSACLMGCIQAFALWFPPGRIATMIALAYSMGGLGALTASAPVELALRALGWRDLFWILGALTLALSALFWFWVPEDRGHRERASWGHHLRGVRAIAGDAGFWRIAVAIGTNQCAVVSLFTLWITAWLRDVAGYSGDAAAQALAAAALSLAVGYFFFGRTADRLARAGRSQLPLFAFGVLGALAALAVLAAGITAGAVLTWCVFVFFGTGATLAHSIATRRYPLEMAGRVNTALNTFTFFGIFAGQWGTGAILALFPATGAGYDPRGYGWALSLLWLVQAAGLAWLWRGRRLLATSSAAPAP